MGKNEKVFKAGDFVFAKIKGFRPWPAKVMMAAGKYKYCVYFFGTKEFGKRLKGSELFNYTDTKARHGKLDNAKKEFSDAIAQIEAAIKGNDISPPLENFDLERELERSRIGDDVTFEESVVEEEESEKNNSIENGKKKAARKEKEQESDEEEAQDIENEVVVNTNKKTNKKRSLDTSDSSESKATKDRVSTNKTRKSPATLKQTDSNENSDMHVSPPKKIVIRPDADPKKTELLKTEFKMWSSILDIKKSLSLEKANTKTCIQLLETLKSLSPKITQIMLKKNPNCVETIRRLKRYVGNTSNWEMNEEEKAEFSTSASTIRDYADEIYDVFKVKFNFDPEEKDKSFWEEFLKAVDVFESLTQDHTEKFIADLCFDEELSANSNCDDEVEMADEDIPDN